MVLDQKLQLYSVSLMIVNPTLNHDNGLFISILLIS